MATSTQQKQELFKTIWATAEDLRNSVDGWDFKQYVLGMLFNRFNKKQGWTASTMLLSPTRRPKAHAR